MGAPEVVLLIRVHPGELVVLRGHVGFLAVSPLGLGLPLDILLRSIGTRTVLGHVRTVGLVHLGSDVMLSSRSLLGGGGGRNDLPTTTRRDRLDGRDLLLVGLLRSGGSDGVQDPHRTGLLGSGSLGGGGRGRGDLAAAARSRSAHGVTVTALLLVRFC